MHAIQTSATVAGIVLTIDPGDEVPIFGDPTRLHQLLGNLLSNAIKFSPRGGRVHVIVDNVDSYARVQVLDEGPGHPRGRARPALRALLPAGLVDRDGRARAPASAWPSPSRWPRPTRASSTSSTRRAGRPPSGCTSPCARRRHRSSGPAAGRAEPVAGPATAGLRRRAPQPRTVTRPGSLPTGAPTDARRRRRGRPRAARRACPARPRGRGRAPRSGRAGRWWPAGAPPPARSCPP